MNDQNLLTVYQSEIAYLKYRIDYLLSDNHVNTDLRPEKTLIRLTNLREDLEKFEDIARDVDIES